jgi:hypothetical protein
MGFFGNRDKGDGSSVAGAPDPFAESPLSQVGAEGSQVGFPMSNADFATPAKGESTGTFDGNGGSQFFSMMGPENSPSSDGRTRKLALVGLVVVALAGGGVLLTGEEGGNIFDSLFSGFSSGSNETTATDTVAQDPATSTEEVVEEEVVEEEVAEEGEMLEPVETEIGAEEETYEYTSVGIEGEYSKEKVWEALKHTDDWRNAGEHDSQILSQYFSHPKVWVRLAALEVAVLQKGLSRDELYSAGKDISDGFNHGQIVRYMQRVRFRDINTFNEMMRYLQLI